MFDEVGVGRAGQSGNRKSFREGVRGKELMIEDFIDSHSPRRVQLEHFGNEVFGCFADLDGVWEGIVAHPYLLVGRFDVVGLEGRLPDQHSEGDHPETPYVGLVRVAILVLVNRSILSRIYGAI